MDYFMQTVIGEHLYRVYFDNDNYLDDDWVDEETKAQIERGDLVFWGVKRLDKCPTCELWHEVDALWGMLHSTPEEAIQEYIGDRWAVTA